MNSPIDPGGQIREAMKLLTRPYDSEEERKKTMFRYMMRQQGLSMFLYSLYPKGFPHRVRYVRLIREAFALLALALMLSILWIGRFAPMELAEILAVKVMRIGFFSMMGIVAMMWGLALVTAFRARSALLNVAYEVLTHLTAALSGEERNSNATDP